MTTATDTRARTTTPAAAPASATAGAPRGTRPRPTGAFWLTVALFASALVPLPSGPLRALRQSARSLEPGAADRRATEAGYYQGLINVGHDGTRSELALRLLGKPTHWVKFSDIGATKYLPGDPLQFELYPNVRETAFGAEFTTNALGLRDVEYGVARPPGVTRVALLGASIDMGWGVATGDTYENLLETWLNRHARRRGLARRFEVINFAVAAYSPLHRLETYRRKAAPLGADLVLYAATLLDPRLLEIQLCNVLREGVGLGPYPCLLPALTRAAITPADLARDAAGTGLANKDVIKTKLRDELWPMIDAIVGALAAEARANGHDLWYLMIPRAGDSDAPGDRDEGVARHVGIAAHHALPVVDLTGTFDEEDPADVEIAAWDDHPNARGHRLLFRALARAIATDPALYRTLFDADLPASTLAADFDPAPTPDAPRDADLLPAAYDAAGHPPRRSDSLPPRGGGSGRGGDASGGDAARPEAPIPSPLEVEGQGRGGG
jgi:hypothetical protein